MVKKFLASCLLLLLLLSACSTYRPSGPALVKFDLGQTLFNQGKFEESIPYFEQSTVEDPQFAQAYLYLGRAQISLRRWREAIPPLRAAYRLAPDEARQEVFNLLMDAFFAAAANSFPPTGSNPPARRSP